MKDYAGKRYLTPREAANTATGWLVFLIVGAIFAVMVWLNI